MKNKCVVSKNNVLLFVCQKKAIKVFRCLNIDKGIGVTIINCSTSIMH